jgi:diaminopimelate decarboxylase
MESTLSRDILLGAAGRFGLPLYVYDARTIARQVSRMRDAFTVPRLEIRYACKALSNGAILRLLHGLGCGMDTVSAGEAMLALRAGVEPSSISFTPNGIRLDEYDWAVREGLRIHVDRMDVLEWLGMHHPGAAVTLRFNPGIRAGSHEKLQVGSSGSKFGLPASSLDDVVSVLRKTALRVTGVHVHVGSDIGSIAHFSDALDFLLGIGAMFSDTLEHVDIGGGFKVRYHPSDPVLDLPAFGAAVSDRFNSFCNEISRPLALTLEPGKYLVSEAGYFLFEVSGVREDHPTAMAWVNSGFNHFVRPMNYGAYHHIANLTRPEGEERHYDVVGYLCETDTFAVQRPLPEVRSGDVLCLFNAGAYGYSMASQYNMRPRPAEVLFADGECRLIRRRETFEDLILTDLGV